MSWISTILSTNFAFISINIKQKFEYTSPKWIKTSFNSIFFWNACRERMKSQITPRYINPLRSALLKTEYHPKKTLCQRPKGTQETRRCERDKGLLFYTCHRSPGVSLVHIWLGFFGVAVLTMNTSSELNWICKL